MCNDRCDIPIVLIAQKHSKTLTMHDFDQHRGLNQFLNLKSDLKYAITMFCG